MSTKLEAKAKEILGLEEKAKAIYDEVGDGEPTREQFEAVKDINKQIEEKQNAYLDLERFELGKEANEKRMADMRKPVRNGGGSYSAQEDQERTVQGSKSWGDQFLENPAIKSFLAEHMNGNQLRSGEFKQTPPVEVKVVTGSSDTSAGALVRAERMPGVVGVPFQPLNIRDLITVTTTDSDSVEFVREVAFNNNAAPVAEATASGGSSGLKPESDLELELDASPVRTMAHWVPATRRALADAGQIRTYIDQRLRNGLDELMEAQVLTGTGSGQNLTGILNTTGILTQAFSANPLTTTRKARTKVRVTGRATPTAFVMHPNDWEALDLTQDGENRYYFGGPTVLGNPRLWGLPVVENEEIPEGTALVADFRLAYLWDRQQTQVYVSDSHADFFIRNLIAILAEMRAAFAVLRPAAFVSIDLTA